MHTIATGISRLCFFFRTICTPFYGQRKMLSIYCIARSQVLLWPGPGFQRGTDGNDKKWFLTDQPELVQGRHKHTHTHTHRDGGGKPSWGDATPSLQGILLPHYSHVLSCTFACAKCLLPCVEHAASTVEQRWPAMNHASMDT